MLVFRLGAVSEERDTYERETARLQSQLQLEQAQRAEMAAHVKVKGIGLKGTGLRARDCALPVPAAAGAGPARGDGRPCQGKGTRP